jgi:protein MYSM1
LLNVSLAFTFRDPFTLVKCEPFLGAPNSHVHGCQPFAITVESNVLLAMDFHAHLMQTEVIGFLAGHWIIEERSWWLNSDAFSLFIN